MNTPCKMRTSVALAATAGLGLRLLSVFYFPTPKPADTTFYIELARNWIDHGVYGVWINGALTPIDMRTPGYPAFLAAVGALFGRSILAILLVQAAIGVASCFLIAALAARLAPQAKRSRVWLAALWLSAICPFTANYSSVVLTETLTIFLTSLALLVFAVALQRETVARDSVPFSILSYWFLAGIIVGIATLVRPESPLIAIAAGLALLVRWRRRVDWTKLGRAVVLIGVGMILPLLPWAARNWRTLHEVQFLSPRYSNLPGETAPTGFYDWTRTWLWRFRDVYLVPWRLEDEAIPIADIPASAFDSPQQRTQVAELLDQYNNDLTLTPELDRSFEQIARNRIKHHPIETVIAMPLLRAVSIWFTPRLELLPFSGDDWPILPAWEDDRADFLATIGLWLLNTVYVGLGIAGLWISRRRPGVMLLLSFILVRTAFFTHIEAPEPRYTLECFPALIALAAQVWSASKPKIAIEKQ